MLTIPHVMRIYVYAQAADMRNGADGLSGLVKSFMGQDPLSGNLFLFRNRRGNKLKLLYWDRNGYAIWSKHLQRGTFRLPAAADGSSLEIDVATLTMILEGIDLTSVRRLKRFVLKIA